MYLEEILDKFLNRTFADVSKINFDDFLFLNSVQGQLNDGYYFTAKQAFKSASVLKKYADENTISFLEKPEFSQPFRVIKKVIQVSLHENVVVNNKKTLGHAIFLKSPYDEDLNKTINSFKSKIELDWEQTKKVWVFPLSEQSILSVRKLLEKCAHELDDRFVDLLNQVKHIENNIENIVPMLDIIDNVPVIKNNLECLPDLKSTDIIESIFEARKLGITLWSDQFTQKFEQLNVDFFTKNFLKSEPTESFILTEHPISLDSKIGKIIKYMSPTLFIARAGVEIKNLKEMHTLLNFIGVDSSQISILFRLSSSDNSHRQFNEYVRDHNLNNPINENTRAVMIGPKLPKPLLLSKIKFNTIVNFSNYKCCPRIKEYICDHENVITYSI